MKSYILTFDSSFARLVIDGVKTQIWHNTENNQEYLKWISEGNTPISPEQEQ